MRQTSPQLIDCACLPNAAVVEWLRRIAPQARRYGSICSGAFLLAATGLIDGRRVTTH
jgi:transcriptional regulator GlxA family with amidase domain